MNKDTYQNKKGFTILLFLIAILFLFIVLIFPNFVYNIKGSNNNYSIKGKIVYNKNKLNVLINKINYQKKDKQIKDISFHLYFNNKNLTIIKLDNCINNSNQELYLKKYLSKLSLKYNEKKDKNNILVKDELENNILLIKIEILNIDEKIETDSLYLNIY